MGVARGRPEDHFSAAAPTLALRNCRALLFLRQIAPAALLQILGAHRGPILGRQRVWLRSLGALGRSGSRRLARIRGWDPGWLAGKRGQADDEGRSLRHPTLHRDASTMVFHDPLADRQAQAGALLLGREERNENVQLLVTCDSATGIRDM